MANLSSSCDDSHDDWRRSAPNFFIQHPGLLILTFRVTCFNVRGRVSFRRLLQWDSLFIQISEIWESLSRHRTDTHTHATQATCRMIHYWYNFRSLFVRNSKLLLGATIFVTYGCQWILITEEDSIYLFGCF